MKFVTPPSLTKDNIKILMIGCGGTGSELLKLLTKTHIAIRKLAPTSKGLNLTLWDGDSVSESNIGRQNFYQGDTGFNKAELSISRINCFHGLSWKAIPKYMDPSRIFDSKFDLLMTCTDSANFRAEIGKQGRQKTMQSDQLWLDAGNGQFSGQVVLGHLGSPAHGSIRLPNVADLYPELTDMVDDSEPSCSLAEALSKQDLMVNVIAAMWMNNIFWQLIRHGGVQEQGVLFNLRKGLSLPIKIDEKTWQCMGYKP